jgi:23S rRNA pseudouridine2605 synthase
LIREGRVEVDRQVVTELGTRVDPSQQEIRVDGEALRRPRRLYFAVNKPVGIVTTSEDPGGRPRVIDLVPTEERVFAVGRLDRSSEGLILVTNDGEFANRITHPRYGVEKAYLVRVAGSPDQRQIAQLKKGVHLAEGFAKAQSIVVKKQHGHSTDLIIVLNEGRNREIRRILARVGHKVLALKRIAVGPVKLGDLPLGDCRPLKSEEVRSLLEAAREKRRQKPRRTSGSPVRPEKQAKSTGEHPPRQAEAAEPYLQKRALLEEPLSLDDLLRDDLDEGSLTIDDMGDASPPTGGDEEGIAGSILDYEGDFSPPEESQKSRRPTRPRREGGGRPRRDDAPRQRRPGGKFGGKRGGQRGDKQGGKPRGERGERVERGERRDRSELESRPRESFGKKRGGKRVLGPPEEGRGPAGAKTGKIGFRPKRKKQKPKAHGADNQRRGERRGGQQGSKQRSTGKPGHKPGGKRKGRR